VAELGKINKLKVLKQLDFGIYLDGEQLGEILMPTRYVPENVQIDDFIDVFIYLDSEDRLLATSEKPFAMVGEFAMLQVVSVDSVGAFLDWGLPKDLLVPFREQKMTMEEGKWYIVYVYIDVESRRIAATSKLDKCLDNLPPDYTVGQEVDLLICQQTEIGYKAIINNLHWGILYKNETPVELKKGDRIKGYIKKIREDEKVDLSLYESGYDKVGDITKRILDKLEKQGGFIEVTDKSSSEHILHLFGISKKAYKMAVGALYKARKISLEPKGIRLVK
jgi:uncharacterized protein